MRLEHHTQETMWLTGLVPVSQPAPGVFAHCAGRGAGRDWLKRASREDRKAFSELGRMSQRQGEDWHSLGGRARAEQGMRDARGKFTKGGSHAAPTETKAPKTIL